MDIKIRNKFIDINKNSISDWFVIFVTNQRTNGPINAHLNSEINANKLV